jgi:NAD-dependent DNA ligase
MNRETPSWLVFLVVFFAFTAASAFGCYLFFHAQAASREEERLGLRALLTERVDEQQRLEKERNAIIAQQAGPIVERMTRLEKLAAANNEHEVAIQRQLLPAHRSILAEGSEAIAKQVQAYGSHLNDTDAASADMLRELGGVVNSERAADEERTRERNKVQTASQEIERLKKEQRAELAVLDSDIAQREARVRELIDRIDLKSKEMRSDGQLLRADASNGFVVIDRGHADNLRRGTRFQVYNRRGGKNIIKGEVEVQEVQDNISLCRVLSELDANDPLIAGDQIHNQIYNPDEVKIFVISGIFDRFNRDELARFITEAGGRIEDRLTTRTHYLVAGKGSAESLKEASTLGVTILSEDQALELVRPSRRFSVRQGMTFALAGEFTAVDRNLVRDFITANGGIVVSGVQPGLHVLVVGAKADETVARARAIGATIMGHEQFIHLVAPERRLGR